MPESVILRRSSCDTAWIAGLRESWGHHGQAQVDATGSAAWLRRLSAVINRAFRAIAANAQDGGAMLPLPRTTTPNLRAMIDYRLEGVCGANSRQDEAVSDQTTPPFKFVLVGMTLHVD